MVCAQPNKEERYSADLYLYLSPAFDPYTIYMYTHPPVPGTRWVGKATAETGESGDVVAGYWKVEKERKEKKRAEEGGEGSIHRIHCTQSMPQTPP